MAPRVGWYSRTAWMETFRPDGKGHVLIGDGITPPEDIVFDEIVCDWDNADAGADNADGSEGRIYYTGSDSLCADCGRKAEVQELERVRQTLSARGWKPDDNPPLDGRH